jgi:hypothetical protein
LSTIHELPLRREVSDEGVAQSSAVAVNEVQHNVVEEAPFNGLDKVEVAHRLAINTTTIGVEEEVEDVALAGKTMISRNEIVTHRSTFVQSGR